MREVLFDPVFNAHATSAPVRYQEVADVLRISGTVLDLAFPLFLEYVCRYFVRPAGLFVKVFQFDFLFMYHIAESSVDVLLLTSSVFVLREVKLILFVFSIYSEMIVHLIIHWEILLIYYNYKLKEQFHHF